MTRFRSRSVALMAGAIFLLTFGLVLAGSNAPRALAQTPTTPNAGTPGSTIYVFCLDFGKDFPKGQSIAAQGLADANVRSALNYALEKGYIQSNPYEVQLALWKLSNGDFHDVNNRGTALAQEIVANAGTAPAGSASDVGSLTIANLQPADANSAYGKGTVTGNVPANVPVGFLLPASAATFQRLISVVINAQATPDAAPATGNGGMTPTTTGPTAAGILVLLLAITLIVSGSVVMLAVARRTAR